MNTFWFYTVWVQFLTYSKQLSEHAQFDQSRVRSDLMFEIGKTLFIA